MRALIQNSRLQKIEVGNEDVDMRSYHEERIKLFVSCCQPGELPDGWYNVEVVPLDDWDGDQGEEYIFHEV